MIKSILSFILSLLILLPSCGMAFADSVDMLEHHLQLDHSSYMSEMNHHDDSHDTHPSSCDDDCCCLNSSTTSQERNIYSIFLVEPSFVIAKSSHTLYNEAFITESEKFFEKVYRKNDPPDPSEYISLIGNSVKHLN